VNKDEDKQEIKRLLGDYFHHYEYHFEQWYERTNLHLEDNNGNPTSPKELVESGNGKQVINFILFHRGY
jgi:hypothetical protein